MTECWLHNHVLGESCGSLVPLSSFVRLRDCDYQMDPHHLVTQREIKRAALSGDLSCYLADRRNIVPACRRHHDLFHRHRLVVPREALPAGVEDFAAELGLEWWLADRYGELVEAA